ncbi:MAG: hypothetical protein K9W44_10740 [Candidatus Lokiarchaeota archaeon]|nr:hypothetical protein [Candidatus Harpocratesius repetitus]
MVDYYITPLYIGEINISRIGGSQVGLLSMAAIFWQGSFGIPLKFI